MHRDADGAGLVGDGAGDGLADPPGRVGRELVAAAILVFVHRPHQAGVAFLDEIEEGQAAVAVFLGDRHHQPQVAARQGPLGVLVFGEALADGLDALAERGRVLERHHLEIAQLLAEVGPVLAAAALRVEDGDLPFEVVHPLRDLIQLLHERLDLLRADRQLLDQDDRLAAAHLEAMPQLVPLFLAGALVEAAGEVLDVLL